MRPSRLGLARVSLLRGQVRSDGPSSLWLVSRQGQGAAQGAVLRGCCRPPCQHPSSRCARCALPPAQGPGKGTPCIDDYIKSAEPVYDYLTKFRWVGGWGVGGVMGLIVGTAFPAAVCNRAAPQPSNAPRACATWLATWLAVRCNAVAWCLGALPSPTPKGVSSFFLSCNAVAWCRATWTRRARRTT